MTPALRAAIVRDLCELLAHGKPQDGVARAKELDRLARECEAMNIGSADSPSLGDLYWRARLRGETPAQAAVSAKTALDDCIASRDRAQIGAQGEPSEDDQMTAAWIALSVSGITLDAQERLKDRIAKALASRRPSPTPALDIEGLMWKLRSAFWNADSATITKWNEDEQERWHRVADTAAELLAGAQPPRPTLAELAEIGQRAYRSVPGALSEREMIEAIAKAVLAGGAA